jgi:hypothetical protein
MKRILSLDGGGIRGIFTLQILARIEALLREEAGNPDLRLAEVFDLIAGTSTGAIIAAFLAWGKSVAEIEQLYLDFGPLMFRKERWYRRIRSKYRADAIADFFREHFREPRGEPALVGSRQIKPKLLIVMRNATTGSPWPVTNNPDAHYNDPSREDCNLNIPLWKLLRASTAAPTFFPPERIDYGKRQFLFVDGGVTPFLNPALVAVLTATLPQYRLCWPTGRDALHVISIGTGHERPHFPAKAVEKVNLRDQFKFLIPALLGSVAIEQDVLCRILGDCVFGEAIDREMGELSTASLFSEVEQKFTYVRYDKVLNAGTATGASAAKPIDTRLDRVGNMPMFQQLGREYAAANVRLENLYPRNWRATESGARTAEPQ